MYHRLTVQALLSLGLLAGGSLCLDDRIRAADRPATGLLQLTNDGFVSGELRASEDAKVWRWSSPAFVQPLSFPVAAVKSVRWPSSGAPPLPQGDFCFELEGDDVLFGDLLTLSAEDLEIASARFGRLHVPREKVRRFYRWNGAELVYFGPHGLSDWKDLSTSKAWRDEGGPLATNQFNASVFGSPGLPDKAMIEVELAWKQKPDFVLELGADERVPAAAGVFRIEVWENDLVIVGESTRDADLASLQVVKQGEGSARLQLYLDQVQKKVFVLSHSGLSVATLKIDSKDAKAGPGIQLTNKSGDVRLQSLRVTRWNGVAPQTGTAYRARLQRANGSVVFGQLKAYDPKTREFTLTCGKEEVHVGFNELADVFLAPAADFLEKQSSIERTKRAIYRDGSRLSGTLTRMEDKGLMLACPGVKEPLRVQIADLQGLANLQGERTTSRLPVIEARPGQLKLDGVSLRGRLVDSADGQENRLNWLPDLALAPSALVPGIAGEIVYRELPQPKPNVPEGPQILQAWIPAAPPRQAGLGEMVANFLFGEAPPPRPVPAHPSGRKPQQARTHLRSGDIIPCEVTAIDEHGLTFKSPLSAAQVIPNAKIKSVELIPTSEMPRLNEVKRDRLLTLPRLQKDAPPTHLICSRNGDFLRGRIVEMNDQMLKVEVRLEVKTILRDRVAQIIWLHADELTDRRAEAAPRKAAIDRRVQVVRGDGNRLTFALEKASMNEISGTSDVLAACHADLVDVDLLLLGSAIEDSAAKLAYNLWKLHHAAEPKFVEGTTDESPDGEPTGKNSPLVGQAAHVFKLPTLDGAEYDLAARKGKIVILDFWATWCGPCMQTAPLFEEVMREFAGRNVELVGVNMEEQPDQIKSMLERHKLKFRVALDRDGAIAARYNVTAIPQTVVIDREGKIARLFVGGGKKTADALRKAIQELLEAKP